MTMQLGPGTWRVVLSGDTAVFLGAGGRSREILTHTLERMVAVSVFSPGELAYWGIEVRPLSDADEIVTVPGEA